VTREGTRSIAALAVAIFAAVLLASCGGSDSSSSTTSATSPSSTEAGSQSASSTGSTEASAPKKGPANGQPKGKDNGGGEGGASAGSGSSDYTPKPLRVSGGGSAPFVTSGGDNSIQEYGDEAGESELVEAAEVLHAFLVARANEDFPRTCSYLTRDEVRQLEQLASQSPQLKDRGCAAVIEALAAEPLTAAVKRELTEVNAASLRVEGDEAFLIYTGSNGTGYFMRMVNEDGTWKVAGLSPTAFP
jgi:hypothetical protein